METPLIGSGAHCAINGHATGPTIPSTAMDRDAAARPGRDQQLPAIDTLKLAEDLKEGGPLFFTVGVPGC